MKTTICDACEKPLRTKNEYYSFHIAIYLNHSPEWMGEDVDMPEQLLPQEADLCKYCWDKFFKYFNVKKIVDHQADERAATDGLWK